MKKLTTQSIAFLLMLSISSFFACKKDKPVQTIIPSDPVTDIDGNEYKTVKIGTQTWMAENLKTLKFNDGTSIPFVSSNATWADPNNTSPMACAYENSDENLNTYGALYNWYAASAKDANGKSLLAPEGWHVATNEDYAKLQDYLIVQGYTYNGSANSIAKSLASTSGWTPDDTEGNTGYNQVSNNKTGFTALPAGFRVENDGAFSFMGSFGIWWTSDEINNSGISHGLSHSLDALFYSDQDKKRGMSVRCVKD